MLALAVCALALLVAPDASAQRSQCLSAHADAQRLRMKGSLLSAREKLLVCGQSECPGPVANDCAGWLAEVDVSLSSVVFAVSDERGHDLVNARVSTNGRVLSEHADGRALLLDPGTYTFLFEAPGHAKAEQTISMRQSEKNRIVRVQLASLSAAGTEATAPLASSTANTPRERSHPVPLATYILGGAALVGIGGFAYFGLNGRAKYRDAQRCMRDCDEIISAGKRDYIIADIALAIAIASAPAAIIVYFVAQPDDPEPSSDTASRLTVQPLVRERGAALQWSGTF